MSDNPRRIVRNFLVGQMQRNFGQSVAFGHFPRCGGGGGGGGGGWWVMFVCLLACLFVCLLVCLCGFGVIVFEVVLGLGELAGG